MFLKHKLRYAAVSSLCAAQITFAATPSDLQGLTVEKAVQIAWEHNHDLRLSTFAVDNASAAKATADVAPNPTLTVQTLNINPAVGIGAGNFRSKTVDSTVRIDQLIERGGKRELRKKNAELLEDAAHRELQDARRQMQVSVSQAYYDLLAAQQKLTIVVQTSTLNDAAVAAAQKRLKVGDIATSDVARLQVDALRAQNDVAQSTADVSKARLALILLLGQNSNTQIELVGRWPESTFEVGVISDSVTDRRADVLATKARLDAALAASRLARASLTRDVSVGVQYEHWPSSSGNAQGTGNSYGVSVQIPLFINNTFKGEILAAEVALNVAQENYEKARNLARNDLLRSAEDARTAYAQIQRYEQSLLVAAKKSADAAEFAFTHGAVSVMDVLDARRTYRATQLDAVAARANYAKSLVAWQAAILESN